MLLGGDVKANLIALIAVGRFCCTIMLPSYSTPQLKAFVPLSHSNTFFPREADRCAGQQATCALSL